MSILSGYVGEDNTTGFSQIVPSLCPPGGFSSLGKRTRSSSSLSSVFDDLEEHQQKRKDKGEDALFPFEAYAAPKSADSGVFESEDSYGTDDLDLSGVEFDFGSIATTSQQRQLAAATSALDFSTLEFLPPFRRTGLHQQLTMQAAGEPSGLAGNREPRLVIVEEPEEYYRARYESEGVRAPLKGVNDNHPTVKVVGPCHYGGRVDVELVYEDKTRHASCSLDLSEERKNALTRKIGPHSNMTAVFEDLRIRKEIRSKKKPEMGGKKPPPDKVPSSQIDRRNDKVACLLFTATLDVPGGSTQKLTVMSRPITLNTPPDPAELDWIRPESGHFQGGDEVVIKGSKMTSPKVIFQISIPNPSGNTPYDLPAVVEKDKSHQNVLLVKTPSLPQALVNCMQPRKPIRALVTVSTGRSTRQSNALQFWFIPDDLCNKCMQHVKAQQPIGSSLCTVPLGSSPPSTPNLMDKSILPGRGIPAMKTPPPFFPSLSPVHHHNSSKKFAPHHLMKQEMPPPSLPPHTQFPPHQTTGLITMESSINYGFPGFPGHSPSMPNLPGQMGETKLALDVPTCGTHGVPPVESSADSDADFLSYLMQQSDGDSSTSSPEPEDCINFTPGFVETCPNLSPFTVPVPPPPCSQTASFNQLSPTSVASPPGCSTSPCYSPVTPVTSPPQQHGAVPIPNGNIDLLSGAVVAGNHSVLAQSQPSINYI